MNKLIKLSNQLTTKLTIAGLAVVMFSPLRVLAQDIDRDDPLGSGVAEAEPGGVAQDLSEVFTTIANVLIFLIGAVAVIMLIIGGFRYVISSGDAEAVKSAKNTILYAIIGIVVAFLAFAAVQFVVGQLNPPAASS